MTAAKSPPPGSAEEGKTVWLDLSSPVEATPQAVDRMMDKGSTLGNRYRLLDLIGAGRMSRVFKAIDQRKVEARSPDPHIAVKVLTVPFVNYSDAIEALSRDIESLKGTPHPNIASVMSCERDGDVVYMTMELLAGRSLQAQMAGSKSGAIPRTEALRIVRDITAALESAHSRNILHGDLKPSNVYITQSGRAKIIDFGISRLIAMSTGAPNRLTTATGRLRALPAAYASPELIEAGRLDPRDDVFALACIAWQLMTGEHPFKGMNAADARDAGMKLTCPSSLSEQEFAALSHGLEFERNKRTLSVRQLFAELGDSESRSGGTIPWKPIAGIAILAIAIGAVAAYLAFKPTAGKLTRAASDAVAVPETLPSGETFRDCASCPLMKVVPAGEFVQGSAPDDPLTQPFELPQHSVAIAYSLAVGVFEVTVAQFEQFVADTKMEAQACSVYDGEWHQNPDVSWKNAVEGQTPSHPVSCVSWQDAKRYAAWLSARTHHIYRLPSASEWEYAARGGSTASRPWTDPSDACTYANLADRTAEQRFPGWAVTPCADKFVQSAPVGTFAPNALGLYDMLGNVFEWTEDCWADTYVGAPTDGSARTDADCTQRELRGGSWFTQPDFVRVSYRDRFAPDYRSTSIGFRLVREINE